MLTAEQALTITKQAKKDHKQLFDDYFENTLDKIVNNSITSASTAGHFGTNVVIPHLSTILLDDFILMFKEKIRQYNYFIDEEYNTQPITFLANIMSIYILFIFRGKERTKNAEFQL